MTSKANNLEELSLGSSSQEHVDSPSGPIACLVILALSIFPHYGTTILHLLIHLHLILEHLEILNLQV